MSKRDVVLYMYAINIFYHHARYWVPWLEEPGTQATEWSMLPLEIQARYLDLASCVQDALEEFPEDHLTAAGKVMDSLEELEWLDITRQAWMDTPGHVLIDWATHPLVKA